MPLLVGVRSYSEGVETGGIRGVVDGFVGASVADRILNFSYRLLLSSLLSRVAVPQLSRVLLKVYLRLTLLPDLGWLLFYLRSHVGFVSGESSYNFGRRYYFRLFCSFNCFFNRDRWFFLFQRFLRRDWFHLKINPLWDYPAYLDSSIIFHFLWGLTKRKLLKRNHWNFCHYFCSRFLITAYFWFLLKISLWYLGFFDWRLLDRPISDLNLLLRYRQFEFVDVLLAMQPLNLYSIQCQIEHLYRVSHLIFGQILTYFLFVTYVERVRKAFATVDTFVYVFFGNSYNTGYKSKKCTYLSHVSILGSKSSHNR